MNRKFFVKAGSLIAILLMGVICVNAQISATGSSFSESTQYPVFQETDNIFVFCGDEGVNIGSLTAQTSLAGTKTFEWQKYNNQSAAFEFYFSESSDANQSTISNLENGCYKVNITVGAELETYRAWVLNDWFTVEGSVGESNCEYFELNGSFASAELVYYDLTNNSQITVSKDIRVKWESGSSIVGLVNSVQVFNPPPEDTDYKYTAFDRFGCETDIDVTYTSIVTEASFTIDANFTTGQEGEAPLEVTFTNTSKNGDPDKYGWFFFKDLDLIKRESENSDEPIDSIAEEAYNESPIYTYENTGTYMVKLVSKKQSTNHTCVDTFYLGDYIKVDSSYVIVPNVFTPNGDGVNDNFIIKFWSMQQIKISLFNRWGRTVNIWEKSNIRGFEGSMEESVWDGRIGGKYASPGVYYYMVEGIGRDGKKRRTHGFFHLFRDKK